MAFFKTLPFAFEGLQAPEILLARYLSVEGDNNLHLLRDTITAYCPFDLLLWLMICLLTIAGVSRRMI